MARPDDQVARLWVESCLRAAGRPLVTWMAASAEDIAAFYARIERDIKALDAGEADPLIAQGDEDDAQAVMLTLAQISADPSPTIRFVNGTFYDALKAGASDIHMETTAQGLLVRYRLDGVLHTAARSEGRDFADRAISRLKVLADLDISERRIPQDGRLKLRMNDRLIDVRVSIMPSLHGEDAVLRILDRYQLAGGEALSLTHLSFDDEEAQFICRMASLPYGLFLVTGPTGSGKTTTLYSVLSEVNTGLDKIVTIEDPVEYQVQGVLQIPVNEAKGLSFARGLRSILRHDPDKIMVGEMRDAETAHIAVQAALTGHQVFATVHANNVFDVIGRLATMQVDPYNLVSALNGVLAQRLIRQLCPACKAPHQPDARAWQQGELPADLCSWPCMQAVGCAHCRGTGYKGRRAIAQTLSLDIELRSLIAEKAPPLALRQAARERGLRTLRDAALNLVRTGITSLDEANRVTAAEE